MRSRLENEEGLRSKEATLLYETSILRRQRRARRVNGLIESGLDGNYWRRMAGVRRSKHTRRQTIFYSP